MQMTNTEVRYPLTGIGLSWGAILAGAAVSLALTLLLLWLAVALGFTVVSPWANSGVSATTFKVGTGIYLIVIAMISSALGGHLAGRLRSGWEGVHPNEVYFRDTASGFITWALATLIGALVLGAAASGIIGSTAGGLAQVGGSVASQASGPMASYVDQLLRPSTNAAAPQSDGNDSRQVLTRILTASLGTARDLNPDDRAYVAQIVAQRTGLSQQEAEQRVADVVTKAKVALDSARKAAAQLAYWMVAALLIGAFSASIAAAEAGGIRDRNWGNL